MIPFETRLIRMKFGCLLQLLENDAKVVAVQTLKPGENGWNDNGSEIPKVHEENGGRVSKFTFGGVPCRIAGNEGPAEISVNDKDDTQHLAVSVHHFRGDKGVEGCGNHSLEGNVPALLDGHQKHAQLPTHVRNVVQNEPVHSILGAKFSIGRVHKDQVEIGKEDELKRCCKHGVLLEVSEGGIGVALDAEVVANHENVDRNRVEHDDQGSNSLGGIEIQLSASVVEVEQLENERLLGFEVGWCSVEEFVPERACFGWVLRWEDNRVRGHKFTSQQKSGYVGQERRKKDGEVTRWSIEKCTRDGSCKKKSSNEDLPPPRRPQNRILSRFIFRTLADPMVLPVRGVSSSTMLSVLNVFQKKKGMVSFWFGFKQKIVKRESGFV